MSKRIGKDMKELNNAIEEEEMPDIEITQNGDDYIMRIPGEGYYHKGIFDVLFVLADFPTTCPSVTFQTKIYHPNVDDAGLYCSSLLTGWSPCTTIMQLVQEIIAMFTKTQFPTARNTEAAELFTKDKTAYVKKVNEFITKFCKP